MKFGSWSYDGSRLDVMNRSVEGDTAYYVENGEWHLIGMPLRRHVITYNCCVHPYPDVTFYLVIRRKPLYYIFNLVISY